MQNNIEKREIYAEGMGGYCKEVPYKIKKEKIRIHTKSLKWVHITFFYNEKTKKTIFNN